MNHLILHANSGNLFAQRQLKWYANRASIQRKVKQDELEERKLTPKWEKQKVVTFWQELKKILDYRQLLP